jgi:hypothetical protein
MRSLSALVIATALAFAGAAKAQELDWNRVDAALGKTATVNGEVHRYALTRSDLKVTVDGVAIKPHFALNGWIAFAPAPGGAAMSADLVFLDSEVNQVMTSLLDNAFDVTAIYDHLLRASPATVRMQVVGRGDPVKMAQAMRAALVWSNTPFEVVSTTGVGPATPPPIDLDTKELDQIIGAKGEADNGVYRFFLSRRDPVMDKGVQVPPAMGVAHTIRFQPALSGKAAVAGDLVATADEVKPLLQALRARDIEVTAVHNHMLDDQPRLFVVHIWANDEATRIAKGLRTALDKTAIAKN